MEAGAAPSGSALTLDGRVPPRVLSALETLNDAGYQAFLVGGCVRDLLLHRTPHDWDIATDALPEAVLALFSGARVQGRFGTVALPGATLGEVEITTFRVEGTYSDRRRPDSVAFVGSLAQDLARRDFTANALALDRAGRLYDPLGGEADLKAGVLRAVGDPAARFNEDALRMMRALRLAAELGFSVEPATLATIGHLAPLLSEMAAERLRVEFMRLLAAPCAGPSLELLRATGLLQAFLPELASLPASVWADGVAAVLRLPRRGARGALLRLAALCLGAAGPARPAGDALSLATALTRRLRLSRGEGAFLARLLEHMPALDALLPGDDPGARRLAGRAGRGLVPALVALARAAGRPAAPGRCLAGVLVRREAVALEDLAVGASEVMEAAGVGPGPALGALLAALLDEVLADPARNNPVYLLGRAGELGGLYRRA